MQRSETVRYLAIYSQACLLISAHVRFQKIVEVRTLSLFGCSEY
jgi:hypothetical protein